MMPHGNDSISVVGFFIIFSLVIRAGISSVLHVTYELLPLSRPRAPQGRNRPATIVSKPFIRFEFFSKLEEA